jgi:adenylylsulfate kinase
LFPAENFAEIYLSTPLETCALRDPKGLYARAKAGSALGLTGLQAPYEVPVAPDLTLDTSQLSVPEALRTLLVLLRLPWDG